MGEIDVRVDHPGWREALNADPASFARAVFAAAMRAEQAEGDVELLLSGDGAVRALNASWRGKDAPTNVLSFPAPPMAGYLGDVVLAFETVRAEAAAQGKGFTAHSAHLLAHGLLHLLGYDHEEESEAERMEARERAILAGLGFADPYAPEARK